MDVRLQPAPFEVSAQKHHCIRVALADDHPIVLYALREVLACEADMKVIGESGGGAETLRAGRYANADILIADFRISDPSVTAALRMFQQDARKPKLILLTASVDKNELVQALKLGCSGVVLKRSAAEDIVACIRKVSAGGMWVDCQTEAFARLVSHAKNENHDMPGKPYFSRREREILDLLMQGFTNPEIARRLLVSTHTVKNHLHHMYDKIGATDRLELMLYAVHENFQRATECNRPIHSILRRRKESCVPSLAWR